MTTLIDHLEGINVDHYHKIIDQIKQKEENPKILVLGDFNDDPINSSFKKVLKTKGKKKDVIQGDLYNPFEKLFKKGYNTCLLYTSPSPRD